MMNTGDQVVPSTHGLLSTVAYQLEGQKPVYALEGAVSYSGSLIQWLRDQLELFSDAKDTDELAAEDNGGVYFVPAFNGLFAPHWEEDARGVICGLTAYNSKRHLVRAALEASAFQALDVLEAMELDSGVKLQELRVDGGMTASKVLPQFQADVAMTPVTRPKQLETTAMGAAFSAGLAVGFWRDLDEIGRLISVESRWEPLMAEEERDRTYGYWKKAVDRSKGWVDSERGLK
uniref:glycerol kinase n=1 Tax=Octactis speculum TaxID=3111310 RepID=A0A7S2CSB0_9STRA